MHSQDSPTGFLAAEKSFDIFAGVLDVLVKTFGLQPSTTVETDLKTLKCV